MPVNTIQKILRKFGLRLVKLPPKDIPVDCYTTIQQLIKHHHTRHFCDIGANKGMWSELLYSMEPGLQSAVLFEPQQKYQAALSSLKLGNAKTYLFKTGLGDKETTLTIKGGSASASFLDFNEVHSAAYTGEFIEEEETVEVKTLDGIYLQNSLPQPDVIKIDVQGFELQVLKGGAKTIAKTKFIIIELSTLEFYKDQDTIGDVFNYLSSVGFTLVEIGYIWREEYNINKKMLQFDGIFENRLLV
jgi:FkbM family methyltransferase